MINPADVSTPQQYAEMFVDMRIRMTGRLFKLELPIEMDSYYLVIALYQWVSSQLDKYSSHPEVRYRDELELEMNIDDKYLRLSPSNQLKALHELEGLRKRCPIDQHERMAWISLAIGHFHSMHKGGEQASANLWFLHNSPLKASLRFVRDCLDEDSDECLEKMELKTLVENMERICKDMGCGVSLRQDKDDGMSYISSGRIICGACKELGHRALYCPKLTPAEREQYKNTTFIEIFNDAFIDDSKVPGHPLLSAFVRKINMMTTQKRSC